MANQTLPPMELPEVFHRRLGSHAGHQRMMFEEGQVLLVLHAPPDPGDVSRTGRLFYRSTEGSWSSSRSPDGASDMNNHLSEYSTMVDKLDEQLDNAKSARDFFQLLRQLGPLSRAAKNQRAVLQTARETIREDREMINWRDRAEAIERFTDLLYTDAKNGLDYAMALKAEQHAQIGHNLSVASYRLNTLAALFLPLATVSAVFGMNVPTGLESLPFPVGVILIVGISLAGSFLLKKWLSSSLAAAPVRKKTQL